MMIEKRGGSSSICILKVELAVSNAKLFLLRQRTGCIPESWISHLWKLQRELLEVSMM